MSKLGSIAGMQGDATGSIISIKEIMAGEKLKCVKKTVYRTDLCKLTDKLSDAATIEEQKLQKNVKRVYVIILDFIRSVILAMI